jgi:hypothetical protein
MNSELQFERLCSRFDAQMGKFRKGMSAIQTSLDYAEAIARLTSDVLLADVDGKLWMQRFGLVYCGIIVPSDLFVTPIHAFFSTDGHCRMSDPDVLPWGTKNQLGDSFFSPRLSLQSGVIQVLFTHGNHHNAVRLKPQTASSNLLIVDADFLRYIEEYEGVDRQSGRLSFVRDDPRLEVFLSANEQNVAHIFGEPIDSLRRRPGWFCPAFSELAFVSELSGSSPRYVCIVRCTDGLRMGIFSFFFRQELSYAQRLVVHFFSQMLFAYLGSVDSFEYRRRAILVHNAMSRMHSHFHAMRTALGTLQNKLQVLRANESSGAMAQTMPHVDGAIEGHAEALSLLNSLEAVALSPLTSEAHIFQLKRLVDLLLARYKPPSYRRINIFVKHEILDEQVESLGRLSELAEALYQFADGASNALSEPPRNIEPFMAVRRRLDFSISLEDRELIIRLDCPRQLPEYIQNSIQSVNLLDRLPSTRSTGGRGLLSAIAVIRNHFQGTCNLMDECDIRYHPTASWDIRIPVRIVRQYRLFPDEFDKNERT